MCKTDWVKKCEDRYEDVCLDVTETICEVSDDGQYGDGDDDDHDDRGLQSCKAAHTHAACRFRYCGRGGAVTRPCPETCD